MHKTCPKFNQFST